MSFSSPTPYILYIFFPFFCMSVSKNVREPVWENVNIWWFPKTFYTLNDTSSFLIYKTWTHTVSWFFFFFQIHFCVVFYILFYFVYIFFFFFLCFVFVNVGSELWARLKKIAHFAVTPMICRGLRFYHIVIKA